MMMVTTVIMIRGTFRVHCVFLTLSPCQDRSYDKRTKVLMTKLFRSGWWVEAAEEVFYPAWEGGLVLFQTGSAEGSCQVCTWWWSLSLGIMPGLLILINEIMPGLYMFSNFWDVGVMRVLSINFMFVTILSVPYPITTSPSQGMSRPRGMISPSGRGILSSRGLVSPTR